MGFELAKILFGANAKVYLAGRSEKRVLEAIRLLRGECPSSKGDLVWLPLDLADLTSVKIAVDEFQSKENRLDVLWNNAGVMCTPVTAKSEQVTLSILCPATLSLKLSSPLFISPGQGYDLQIGTNVLGPYLLTTLLYPIMRKTAETAPIDSVRVCWASSITIELSPRGGIEIDDSGSPILSNTKYTNYFVSKAANNLLASEFGKKCQQENILSVVSENQLPFLPCDNIVCLHTNTHSEQAFNPGNLDTGLTRYLTLPILGSIVPRLMSLVMWSPRYGAYTELYAGLSPDLTIEKHTGAYIWPWGHVGYLRSDIENSLRTENEGGSGKAASLLAWCERETVAFT